MGTTVDRGVVPLLAVALLLVGCNLFRSGGDGEVRPIFRKVTAGVAFEMMHDSPDMPVMDVRSKAAFHGPDGHIRGAFNLPREEIPERLKEIAFLDDETFLVYCQADECDPGVLELLRSHGFGDAMLLDGGIEAWREAGFGTVGAGDPPEHEHDGGPGDRRRER